MKRIRVQNLTNDLPFNPFRWVRLLVDTIDVLPLHRSEGISNSPERFNYTSIFILPAYVILKNLRDYLFFNYPFINLVSSLRYRQQDRTHLSNSLNRDLTVLVSVSVMSISAEPILYRSSIKKKTIQL